MNLAPRSLADVWKMLGITPGATPPDASVANQLLAMQLVLQKLATATSMAAVDWDTFEVWVEPGTEPTKVTEVKNGELVVVELTNFDTDNAQTVFVGQGQAIRAPQNYGLSFVAFTLTAVGHIDFSEDGGITELSAVIPAAGYITGDQLATVAQAAMTAAGGASAYTVTFDNVNRLFIFTSDGAGGAGTFDMLLATGSHALTTSIHGHMGFDDTDQTGALTYSSDHPVIPTLNLEGKVVSAQNPLRFANGYPVLAGDRKLLVLEQDLYALLDPISELRAPLQIMRSRIVLGK